MMIRARRLLLALVASSLAMGPATLFAQQAPAAPAPAGLQGDLLKDWQGLKDTMMKISDAMPPEKLDYKPTPDVRTYGEQIMHVASAILTIAKAVDPSVPVPGLPAKVANKAEALKALSDAFDYGSMLIKGQTSATLGETVAGPAFIGPSTRARLIYRTMGHTWDEYGVMTVYLRLNGLVPPASQR